MHDTKSRFLDRILDTNGAEAAEPKTFTAERQHTAQAFSLHVERRDGRRSEGFAWAHFVGYEWTDDGDKERLVVVFGTRAVEIEGQNLGAIVTKVQEGQLNGIRELETSKAKLMQANGDSEPIITAIRSYPEFDDILKQIKGEDEHDTGFVGKTRGR